MKSYILGIVAAAIICAITKGLLDKKTATGRIAFLLSGIMMVTTIIAPLKDISFYGISDYLSSLNFDANSYVREGVAASKNYTADIIKAQTEAYILDKATRMGLEISVEVELDDDNGSVPSRTKITGALSPYAKEALGSYLEDNLGISKENQQWN